ncbi:MAG TPA: TetR/AcrR family transcriptional regulator [Actinomycetota bacterium]|nr:TetR/AcrR family transcriptional regulator [Actinomycetota bacterium]
MQKRRKTQEQRRAETRARLITATLELLIHRGYARATAADIAERAGVTRGALNHHFASKHDLVVQAVEHLLRSTIEDIRALAKRVRAGSMTLSEFIDKLWDMFSGPLFLVTLEYVTEARHSPFLKERLVPVVRDFHAALDSIWREFFKDTGLDDAQIETAFNASLCLLRGMGLQTILRDDPLYYRRIADFWKGILAGFSQQNRSRVRPGKVAGR